ncbi:MAG: hypothetical protein R3F34_03320 [Planctomycetota bacterium]
MLTAHSVRRAETPVARIPAEADATSSTLVAVTTAASPAPLLPRMSSSPTLRRVVEIVAPSTLHGA